METNIPSTGNKNRKPPISSVTLRTLLYSGIMWLLLTGILFLIHFVVNINVKKRLDQAQYAELEKMQDRITEKLGYIDQSLFYLSRLENTRNYLNTKDFHARKTIHSLMVSMLKYQHDFDQIRILDMNGLESIRINMDKEGNIFIVPEKELQNKSKRYYYKESLRLQENQIYLSEFDLSMEQGRVEVPHKPVIRLSRIITDSSGSKIGIAIINFNARSLFDTIEKHNHHPGGQWYLINDKGYFLKGPRPDLDFAFIFPEKQGIGLFTENPELWSLITNEDKRPYQSKNGVFYFKKIIPLTNAIRGGDPVHWTLITHIPPETYSASAALLNKGLHIGAYIMYPLFLLLAIALSISHNRNIFLLNELKRKANEDELSELLNRRAILGRLEYLIKLVSRNNSELSVVFADINGLKLVNDLEGHEAGDRMIKAAARAFKDEIRATDIPARIGGDEFLILLPGCGKGQTELIMERVLYNFENAGIKERGRAYKMAWGSAHWMGESDSLDGLVNRADEQMYNMKKKMKSNGKNTNDPDTGHVPFPE